MDSTIGNYGCLLTCFTMLSGWTDVLKMNVSRVQHNGFYNKSYARTFNISDSEPRVKFVDVCGKQHKYDALPEEDCAAVMKHLDAGNPVILEVNFNARFRHTFYNLYAYDQHFVLLLPGLLIHDPWIMPDQPDQVTPLLSVYGKSLAEAAVRPIYYRVD